MIEVRKNQTTVVRVVRGEYKGKPNFTVREFYQDDNGDYQFGKNGITLPLDKLEEFKNMIAAA